MSQPSAVLVASLALTKKGNGVNINYIGTSSD